MTDAHPLLAEVESFLLEAGMSPTAFGRHALGDPGFVFGLRDGRDCRHSTAERARAQIAQYRVSGHFETNRSRSRAEAA